MLIGSASEPTFATKAHMTMYGAADAFHLTFVASAEPAERGAKSGLFQGLYRDPRRGAHRLFLGADRAAATATCVASNILVTTTAALIVSVALVP